MSILYEPNKELKKIAPKAKIKKLLKSDLTLKKTALNFVDAVDFIDKSRVTAVALKVIANYQERLAKADAEKAGGVAAGEIPKKTDPALLIQRVQNEIVFQIAEGIKEKYKGESYIWLPSDASEPDPEHQLLYGTTRIIGQGEMPGDRYGCKCGMEIITDDKKLDL